MKKSKRVSRTVANLSITWHSVDLEGNMIQSGIYRHQNLLNKGIFSCKESQYETILKIMKDFGFSSFTVRIRINDICTTRLLTKYLLQRNIKIFLMTFVQKTCSFFVKCLKWFIDITSVIIDIER